MTDIVRVEMTRDQAVAAQEACKRDAAAARDRSPERALWLAAAKALRKAVRAA